MVIYLKKKIIIIIVKNVITKWLLSVAGPTMLENYNTDASILILENNLEIHQSNFTAEPEYIQITWEYKSDGKKWSIIRPLLSTAHTL